MDISRRSILSIKGNRRHVEQQIREKQSISFSKHPVKTKAHLDLLPYPIDVSQSLDLPFYTVAGTKVFGHSAHGTFSAFNDPTRTAQCALANWNAYLIQGHTQHREVFEAQADWLLHSRSLLSNGACGWLQSVPSNAQGASRPCLSVLTQGTAISVLVRAYSLTGKDPFLQAACQAVRTFELDILDGGVSAPVVENGVFFEEVAVYPAAHVLNAYMPGLFGLYDYVAVTNDRKIEVLLQHTLETFHSLLDEFDTGFWTRHDLLSRSLATRFYHALHIMLLEALAQYSGCEHCALLAARWASYQRHPTCRLRYFVASGAGAVWSKHLKPWLRRSIFRTGDEPGRTGRVRVCVPITAFPIAGGMQSVLRGVAQVMGDRWEITYLTHQKGPEAEGLEIETFGRRFASYWQFPFVWLYCLAGWGKLFTLLRRGPGYELILPQDGVYTAAFAAVIGKLAGVRVVCMDHGNVTLLDSHAFRSERVERIKEYPAYRRMVARLQTALYWPSLRLLALIAMRCTDQFLIAGDEVEASYRQRFGVHPVHITRYAYTLDADRFTPPNRECRAKMRQEQGIREDALIITLINRLAPEKGLHFAIEGIAQAVSALPEHMCERVKVLIAGDGPLRTQLQADIRLRGLDSMCVLRGEAAPADIPTLLALSDIFLYSGTRGTNYSMAVLEAMAAGCAVVASTRPLSNALLLAEGRGIAVPAEDAGQIGQALILLLDDLERCSRMGQMARDYIAMHHNAAIFRRTLMRVTSWSSLDEFIPDEKES